MDKVKVNEGTKVPVDQTKQRPGSAKKPSHSRRKRPPKRLSQRPNDVYINRSSQFAGQLSRCKRIFDQGFQEVTVHGLGAAIHRAINLSLQLRENYTLSTHTTTSTVQLVDDLEPLTDASSTISKLLSEYQQSLNIIIVISDDEYTRRKEMIEELDVKYEQLSKSRRTGWSTNTPNGGSTEPWEGGAPGTAQRLSMDEIRREQQEMITEQDQGLENLSKALRRQAEMGLAMQGEITEHNALIDEIDGAATKTDDKIRFHTQRVEEVRRKDSCKCTCALVSTILLLLLAIIVIAAVPYGGKG